MCADGLTEKELYSNVDINILDFYCGVVIAYIELCADLLVAGTDDIRGDYEAYLDDHGFKASVHNLAKKIEEHLFELNPELIFKWSIRFWLSVEEAQKSIDREITLKREVTKILVNN